jgi:hypothetical protein
VELLCPSVYQNGSCSTNGVVYGAAAKNGFTGEVKPCQRGILISNKKYMVKEWLHMTVYIGMIRQVFNHVRSKLPNPLCHMSI